MAVGTSMVRRVLKTLTLLNVDSRLARAWARRLNSVDYLCVARLLYLMGVIQCRQPPFYSRGVRRGHWHARTSPFSLLFFRFCWPNTWRMFDEFGGDILHGSRAPETTIRPFSVCIFMICCIFWLQANHENPGVSKPLQINNSWDHAQMVERKKLYHPAERKPLYDQTRPSFFQVSTFDLP